MSDSRADRWVEFHARWNDLSLDRPITGFASVERTEQILNLLQAKDASFVAAVGPASIFNGLSTEEEV